MTAVAVVVRGEIVIRIGEVKEMSDYNTIEPVETKCGEPTIEQQLEPAKAEIQYLSSKINRLQGVIDGLKFGLRCNGISGGDVA